MMNAAKELLTFIENSPSMFHSIETIKGMLEEAGFTYLPAFLAAVAGLLITYSPRHAGTRCRVCGGRSLLKPC